MKSKLLVFFTCLIGALVMAGSYTAKADLDRILDYRIIVEPNEDATLGMIYSISWKVLDSDSAGPLDWVSVGLPNKHFSDLSPLTDNISYIDSSTSGGVFAEVHFDRSYYSDEVIDFSFSVTMDNMYDMNKNQDGYTVYSFTPGWFDDLKVDSLEVFWKGDNVDSWTPACEFEQGYCYFSTSLDKGEKFPLTITYPNDALSFDTSKEFASAEDDDDDFGLMDIFMIPVALVLGGGLLFSPLVVVGGIVYAIARGFGFGKNRDVKITRTKVTYYPNCPGCGAARGEGETKCQFCGTSLVQSEEAVTEDAVKAEDKGGLKHTSNGEYHYTSNPNVFLRVNVVHIPRSSSFGRSGSSGSGGGHHSSSGGGHHSSCAHSSCACACACACAGGGRAGCTNKDFYNTGLKLKFLEKKTKKKA